VWAWTCRAGFEANLVEELRRAGGKHAPAPVAIGPAMVQSSARPAVWPTFARAGFEIAEASAIDDRPGADGDTARVEVAAALVERAIVAGAAGGRPRAWHLEAWVPDADELNPLSARVAGLGQAVLARLEKTRPELHLRHLARADEARRLDARLVELVLIAPDRALVGSLPAGDAPTLAPGGRARAHLAGPAPSRAGRKLVEALEWFGREPDPGDVCVDLGAAPGGWCSVLLQKRARVIAVDPAELAPDVRKLRGLTHVKASAFDFVPSEPVDWLFCDMAWRPVEVAQMLAKWGRRRLAGALISNIKLPMKQRVEFVAKVREIVAGGGWRDVKTRQLYHDREEITLSAWR
jgi:23S rRNA (cytidine2498-2'-O)-methyltransferase